MGNYLQRCSITCRKSQRHVEAGYEGLGDGYQRIKMSLGGETAIKLKIGVGGQISL